MTTHELIWHQMIAELTNHLWQSTLFAVAVALASLAFRKNRAQVRYCLWLSASIKFLVPFALLMNLGNSLWGVFAARQIATELAPPAVSLTVEQIAQPFTGSLSLAPSATLTHTAHWIPIAILSVWVCGFLAVVFVRFRGWLRIRGVLRASTPIDIQAAAAVRSSPGLLEPGVVGVLRPVLLLPEDILQHLPQSQLQAVIAHELSHVRRRDNLTAAIHMVVEAVFWFHPFVWWIGARLIEERERACDEAVLSLGGEPRDYADAIVSVCKLYVESPLTCVAGISGADLKKRIVRIMARHVGLRMGLGRKLLLCAAALLAVAGPVAFGFMQEAPPTSQILHATGPLPSFEVATFKPNRSGPGPAFFGAAGHGAPLDRFIATNVSIKKLMGWAFAGGFLPLPDNEVIGGPNWIDSDRYDIEAKLENSQVAELQKLSGTDRMVQVRRMVQALLADRFKLVVNDTTVTRPVYALVVAKGGPKLKEKTPCVTESGATLPPLPPPPGAPRGSAPEPRGNFIGRPGDMMACQVSVKGLARSLELDPQFGLDRPVVDQTGLTGYYTFDLKWTPDPSPGAVPGPSPGAEALPPDASSSSFFTAIQEQLGLKLESTKGPVEALEVVHIEKPSQD